MLPPDQTKFFALIAFAVPLCLVAFALGAVPTATRHRPTFVPVTELANAYEEVRTQRVASYPDPPDNRRGLLAWGEAAFLDDTLSMYEATGDTAYLDFFLKRARQVLASRDSITKTSDWAGKSLPAWSANGKYTLGQIQLQDDRGHPALVLKTVNRAFNDSTTVTLKRSAPEITALVVSNSHLEKDESFTLEPNLQSVDQINASSELIRLEPLSWPKSGAHLKEVEKLSPPTGRVYFAVHTGMIAAPLARFASIAKARRLESYYVSARVLAEAASAALKAHTDEWYETNAGGGYLHEYGKPVWTDGLPCPHNFNCAIGRAYIYLLRFDPAFSDRARIEKIARLLKASMQLQEDGSYIWRYWVPPMVEGYRKGEHRSANLPEFSGHRSYEDVSHGAIDVQFAVMSYAEGIVFDKTDMERLANTLLKRVLGPDGSVRRSVDGSGLSTQLPSGWFALAATDPALAATIKRQAGPTGWLGVYPALAPDAAPPNQSLLSPLPQRALQAMFGHKENLSYGCCSQATLPFACGELAKMDSMPRASSAAHTCVGS